MDPWRYSLRQLRWMATARQMTAWDHTASIVAMSHNVAVKPSHAKPAIKFHPLRKLQRRKRPLTTASIDTLRSFFNLNK